MCRVSWKSGSLNLLEPSGPHRACNGKTLPLPSYIIITFISRKRSYGYLSQTHVWRHSYFMFIQYQTICCESEETHYCSEATNNSILQISSDTAAVRLLNKSHFGVGAQNCEKRLLASSCSSVRPSVRMEQLGSHWTDFHEILHLSTFRKTVQKM